MAADLVERIPGATLAIDPDPLGLPSPWRTYRYALEQTPPEATHRMILQDDVTLCEHFLEVAGAALAAQPGRIVVLFVGGNPREHSDAVYRAGDRKLHWAELDHMRWCPAVAVAWPVEHIQPFLDFVDAQGWPPGFRADDEIIGRYCRARQIRPLATVPSLVQHLDIVPSLVGKRAKGGADRGRVAACWVGDCDECDPRTINWATGP